MKVIDNFGSAVAEMSHDRDPMPVGHQGQSKLQA